MQHLTNLASLVFLALMILSGCGGHAGHETTPPNIVYILADDMGYGDVSAYNQDDVPKISTPNIDRLSLEGMRFTDAHAPASVCTPTRYGIVTGRYCWRSRLSKGVLRGYGRALIQKDRTTVASLLRDGGYTTGVVGKWHLGLDWAVKKEYSGLLPKVGEDTIIKDMDPSQIDFTRPITGGPRERGFDYSFILPASLDMPPYCYLENDALLAVPRDVTAGRDLDTGYTGAFWRPGKMSKGFDHYQVLPTFISKGIAFIKKQKDSAKPFFLYLPLAAPHTPWVPTPEFEGSSQAGSYGDFVQMVDASVGKVLDALHQTGMEENTLVIFTSDNGPYWREDMIEKYGHRSASIYRGMKADIWEGGHRVPFIVRWPSQIQAGSVSKAQTSLTNLMATAAELAGIRIPEGQAEDSYSILPVLLGKSDTVPAQPALVQQSSEGHFALRKGDWKYIEKRGSGGFSPPQQYTPGPGEPEGQLYNLFEDPGEKSNLYLEYPDKVAELKKELDAIRGNQEVATIGPGK